MYTRVKFGILYCTKNIHLRSVVCTGHYRARLRERVKTKLREEGDYSHDAVMHRSFIGLYFL